jgi:hypothetical protein
MCLDTFHVQEENEPLVLYPLYLKAPNIFASRISSMPLLFS